jgi:hypothetical protein
MTVSSNKQQATSNKAPDPYLLLVAYQVSHGR